MAEQPSFSQEISNLEEKFRKKTEEIFEKKNKPIEKIFKNSWYSFQLIDVDRCTIDRTSSRS